MIFEVIIKPEAEIDLLEIFEWYEKKIKGLGEKFILEFETKLAKIGKTPFSYQIKYKNIR